MPAKSYVYETIYILRPDLSEEVVAQNIEKFQDMVREHEGELVETQYRGKRRLAYEINKHREGIYIQMSYRAPGSLVATLERAMGYSEAVIRFLTVKQEVPKPTPEPEPNLVA